MSIIKSYLNFMYDLDFDDDDVAIGSSIDIDNVCLNIYFSNEKSERNERVNVGSVGTERTRRVNKADDEYAKYNEDYEEEEDDYDYISFDDKRFEFINETKDEWIDSLEGDLPFGKSLDDCSELDNKWKISYDEDDFDVKHSAKSYNSCEEVEDENGRVGIKKKKYKVDPIFGFKCKIFKIKLDGSIKFREC